LLPASASQLDALESKITSASLKSQQISNQATSLRPVLEQALQSDDIDQLSWVLDQRDSQLIDTTTRTLSTENKSITQLFTHILGRFQKESPESQS